MDELRDAVKTDLDPHYSLEEEIRKHLLWSQKNLGRGLRLEEIEDIKGMLSQRGVLDAPEYQDEPALLPRRLRAGTGRTTSMGMRPSMRTAVFEVEADAKSARLESPSRKRKAAD